MAKILIVDDDSISCSMLAAEFTDLGHEVHTAAIGEEAISLAPLLEPDLLVTDWMPEGSISGEQLIEEFRKRNKNIIVIVCTGLPPDQISSITERLQVRGIFQKPFDTDSLLSQAIALLDTVPLGDFSTKHH